MNDSPDTPASTSGRGRIVLLGGAFRPDGAGGWKAGPLVHYLLALTGKEHPRVCVINTATGDDPSYYTRAYAALNAAGARPSHLALFPMPSSLDPAGKLMGQDVILVGGGSVANLAAVWRVHGLGLMLRRAWENGVILSGSSAGAICWFESGTTDSFGYELRPFTDGLGLLEGSYCPHYNTEEGRRPAYHRLVAEGAIPGGWALDDGAALRFDGTTMIEVVRDRDDVSAYRVHAEGGQAVETRVEARLLPDADGAGG